MKLSDYTMIETTDMQGRYQVVLEFNDTTQLSVITGAGTFSDTNRPYEIAVFVNGSFAQMPGITEGDDVRGYMTESDVDAVIVKLHSITGRAPAQV